MTDYATLTVTSGTTSTGAIALPPGHALTNIEFPATFTGATVAIHGCIDGTNFRAIYMDGAAQTVTVGASQAHSINPRVTYGYKEVKLVSASSEAGTRTILAKIEKVI